MSTEALDDSKGCAVKTEEVQFIKIKEEINDDMEEGNEELEGAHNSEEEIRCDQENSNQDQGNEQSENQDSECEDQDTEVSTNCEQQDEVISDEVRIWSRPDFLRGFIKLYESFPCLWRMNSKRYANKKEKEEAYTELLAFCKSRNAAADVDYVKSKINNIRTCYRKELSKVKTSVEQGCVYVPTLWYFNLLSFLKDQVTLCPPKQFVPAADRAAERANNAAAYYPSGRKRRKVDIKDANSQVKKVTPVRNKRKQQRDANNVVSSSSKGTMDSQNRSGGGGWEHYRFDSLADSVSNDLRKMEHSQQLLAEHIINKALFLGLMGLLNSSSDIQSMGAYMNERVDTTTLNSHNTTHSPDVQEEDDDDDEEEEEDT